MTYKIKKAKGRPQKEIKYRSFDYITPKGWEIYEISEKDKKITFKKKK